MQRTRTILTCAATLAIAVCAAGAPPEDAAPQATSPPSGGLRGVTELGEEMSKLGDWDAEYVWIGQSIDRFWEMNAWTDEADLFARDTAQAVAAIPPWEFAHRMETLTGAVRERYKMSDAQSDELRTGMYRMVGQLAFRHAGTMMKHVRDYVETRATGEPFTAEQVARWSQENDPIVDDMRMLFEGLTEELAKTMTPAQRELLARDMASYQRRREAFESLNERWARGEWKPEDWGWPDAAPGAEDRATLEQPAGQNTLPSGDPVLDSMRLAVAHDETAWARYVRLFIARYHLDEGQAQSAWSIHKELELRAADYRRLNREELDRLPPLARETSELRQPIERLFAELDRRLHTLPTTTQRRRAGH